jgi:hypothetical protein
MTSLPPADVRGPPARGAASSWPAGRPNRCRRARVRFVRWPQVHMQPSSVCLAQGCMALPRLLLRRPLLLTALASRNAYNAALPGSAWGDRPPSRDLAGRPGTASRLLLAQDARPVPAGSLPAVRGRGSQLLAHDAPGISRHLHLQTHHAAHPAPLPSNPDRLGSRRRRWATAPG